MSSAALAEEAQDKGYVIGLQTGKVEARLDLDEFVLDRDVLNLFLLALVKLQENDSYNEPWSWYQISGIHGRPFANWDNVGSKPVKHDEKYHTPQAAGYCSHSSVTFPTWHRPYVAMMEQAVYVAMLKIAKDFKDHDIQQRYLNACTRFRFPYWDPCLPRQTISQAEFGIPKIVSNPSVYVRMSDNPEVLTSINNPLYAFRFPKAVQSLDDSDFSWGQDTNVLLRSLGGNKHTVRAPDANGNTDDGYINTYISRHIQSDIGSSLYKVLNVQQSWATFSNDVLDNSNQRRDQDGRGNKIFHSIEGFHDNIHGFLGQGRLEGGSGHIGHPQIAAFDPIFWLHHCNIDRITALWQAKLSLHDSKSWWEQQAAGESNWTIPKGSSQTPSDYLIPFRHPKSSPSHEIFWTSDDVRNWERLGYTYLGKRVISGHSGQNELISFPISLENTSSANLNAFSGQFYGWMDNAAPGNPSLIREFYPIDLSNVEALTGKPSSERPSLVRAHPSRIPSNQVPDANKPDYAHLKGLLTHDGKLRQWNINLQAEKFKFEGTFQILVFLGDFSPNPNHWPTEPNLVGIDVVFSSNPHSGGCSNCEQQASAGLVVTDVLPLTSHLIKWIRSGERIPANDPEAVGCKSLEYEDVYPFLSKNLHWRIADMNLNHRVQVPGIKLCAVDQEVSLPKTFEESPIFGELNIHGSTTHKRENDTGVARGSEPQPESKESSEREKTRGCCGCVIM